MLCYMHMGDPPPAFHFVRVTSIDHSSTLPRSPFWVTLGLPTIHRLGLTLQGSFFVREAAADFDDLAQRAIWKRFGTNVLLV
jgi:hypothetical protein